MPTTRNLHNRTRGRVVLKLLAEDRKAKSVAIQFLEMTEIHSTIFVVRQSCEYRSYDNGKRRWEEFGSHRVNRQIARYFRALPIA